MSVMKDLRTVAVATLASVGLGYYAAVAVTSFALVRQALAEWVGA